MPDRIDANITMQPGLAQPIPLERADASRGQYRGEEVIQTLDPISLLQSAAEELTFEASEDVEAKEIEEREVKSPHDTNERVKAVERVMRELNKLPDLPIEKLRHFMGRLMTQRNQTSSQVLQHVRREFSDVSHQYTALLYARESLSKDPDYKELEKALTDAIDQLTLDHGSKIRAGLNVSVTAQTFADPQLGDIQQLRDFYRETVIGFDNLADAYASIIDKYGEQDFPNALAFLLKAAGDDFAAKGPSLPKIELKTIIDDMYRLEVLTGLQEDSHALVTKLHARSASLRPNYSGHQLLRSVLKLKEERWLRADQINAVGQEMGLDDREIDSVIYFLREFKDLVRRVPLKAYQNPGNREKLLDAVQEALDDAIEREEE